MENIQFLVGNQDIMEQIDRLEAWRPFDERVVLFLNKLSATLLKERVCQQYPDLISLIFWMRKSNINHISSQYNHLTYRIGKGLVFHIAPGNIALSFAYSLATGLLSGNTNIIRMPSREFEQTSIFCEVLNRVLRDCEDISKRICLVKYPHDKSINDFFSSKCKMRVIWGGDDTVRTIRQSPIPVRASEITFANRFSICLIDADKYLEECDYKKTARDFYNDTFLTDQNACSSPRIVIWKGVNTTEAKKVFWESLQDELSNYNLAPVTTVDKLLSLCKYAAYNNCHFLCEKDCKIMRLQVENLDCTILNNLGNSGFFYEYDMKELNEILPICVWELQTLSYIGFEKEDLVRFVIENAPQGIDRIVPVGHTLDFGLIWDGRDIIREMTREIATY